MRLTAVLLSSFFLCGCELLQQTGDFFTGFFSATAEAAPAAAETAASGNWLSAVIAIGVAGVVGGLAEVGRRKRKAKRLAALGNVKARK